MSLLVLYRTMIDRFYLTSFWRCFLLYNKHFIRIVLQIMIPGLIYVPKTGRLLHMR